MWTCSSCGRRFKQRNQMHTCAVYNLDRHLTGKSAAVVAIYHLLAGHVGELGAVEIVPMKSSILFRVKTAFATVSIRGNWVDVYFSLRSEYSSARFRNVVQVSAARFVHGVRLESPDDIDEELLGWLSKARALSSL